MRISLGSLHRNLAYHLADIAILQGMVKEERGLSIYKYRYQVAAYTPIYLHEGQHLSCGARATPGQLDISYRIYIYIYIYIYISARRGHTVSMQREQHRAADVHIHIYIA